MSAINPPLLEGKNLSYIVDGKSILQAINISVSAKEIVTIIGPNGAGKSTLLSLLLGLTKPTQGQVIRKPNLRIGYMPQRLSISPQLPLTVKRFLNLVDKATLSPEAALNLTGVSDLANTDMQYLSGGETQRVLLARALMQQPELLVLDEPVQGVDITGQSQLYNLIQSIRDEHGCGILMVSHDLHLVMASTDHVICINQHICCDGHPEAVTNNPAYLRLFGDRAANLAAYTHHHDHAHDVHGDIVSDNKHHHG